MKNILITGATGFLGRYLLKKILENEDLTPVVLVRGRKDEPVDKRMERVLGYFYGSNRVKVILKRIKIVEGEVDRESLGLDKKIRQSLIDEVDEIYHCAAIAAFRIPLETIRKSNVAGTENVMKFAVDCKNKGRLKRINHISTTYVAGTKRGVFYENELDVGQKFNNTYEQSKFEAEIIVQDYRKRGLEIAVFRPSILTGDSITGKTASFKMLYQPLRFFSSELFEAIPADRNAQFNLIPVDSVAEAIYLIANARGTDNRTFSISNSSTVSAGHFIDVASDFFGFIKPELIPLKEFDLNRLTYVQKNLLDPYIPYFDHNPIFDSSNAKAILSKNKFNYPIVDNGLLTRLFKYCVDSGFIKLRRKYVTAG